MSLSENAEPILERIFELSDEWIVTLAFFIAAAWFGVKFFDVYLAHRRKKRKIDNEHKQRMEIITRRYKKRKRNK